MTIKERFSELIKHYANGNKKAFADKIGVSATVVENVVGKRAGNPSFEVVQKIIFAFENLNAVWLIIGEGEMINSAEPASSESSNSISLNKRITELEYVVEIQKKLIDELNVKKRDDDIKDAEDVGVAGVG